MVKRFARLGFILWIGGLGAFTAVDAAMVMARRGPGRCESALTPKGDDFPTSPSKKLTPGSLCQHPDEHRYAEQIPYCVRAVGGGKKRRVIEAYDAQLGFHIQDMDRSDFKIDHYIPLCMGGSNEDDNLWPQHKSVYKLTDVLEQVACDQVALGNLPQREAIALIRRAKANPPDSLAIADALLDGDWHQRL